MPGWKINDCFETYNTDVTGLHLLRLGCHVEVLSVIFKRPYVASQKIIQDRNMVAYNLHDIKWHTIV